MADVEKGTGEGVYAAAQTLSHEFSPTELEHDFLEPPPSQERSHLGDSSRPLFNMYSKIAEKDDNTMAERWQKDADGMLIFVSHGYALCHCVHRHKVYRQAYSPPSSQHSCHCRSRI